MKGKALRRALQTSEAHRIGGPTDLPVLQDTSDLITPEIAYQMLLANRHNRPINWRRVEEYAAIMSKGEWQLHSQGIILDRSGNILTGQKRLWAIIYSNCSVYMRISRGNPESVALVIDRGDPQSARDLASRKSGRRHSPFEASIARGICAIHGDFRPSKDVLAAVISDHGARMAELLATVKGERKSRSLLMILSAVCLYTGATHTEYLDAMAQKLEAALAPETAERCWGRGAAFSLALAHATRIVNEKWTLPD